MSEDEILFDEDNNVLKLINNISIDDGVLNKINNQDCKSNNNENSDKNIDDNNSYKKPLREKIKDKIYDAKPIKRKYDYPKEDIEEYNIDKKTNKKFQKKRCLTNK